MLENTVTSSTEAKTDPTVSSVKPTPTLKNTSSPSALVRDFFLFGMLAPVSPLIAAFFTIGGTVESTAAASLLIAAEDDDEIAPQSMKSTQV
jgi:hypothetical protein